MGRVSGDFRGDSGIFCRLFREFRSDIPVFVGDRCEMMGVAWFFGGFFGDYGGFCGFGASFGYGFVAGVLRVS